MAELVELSRIYCRLVGARIRGDLQYRASFAMFLCSQFLICFLDFITILVIFRHVPDLEGWSLAEVAFLYGATNVSFNLADVFISQVETISVRIRAGDFDMFLVRPLGALFQLITDEFALRRAGKLAQGVLILAIALGQVDIAWDVPRVTVLLSMLASGAVIFGSIWVVGAAITFWTVETTQLANAFTYGGNFLTQYPIDIYGIWLRRVFAYFVPMAFVNYFPSLFILDKAPPDIALFQFLSPAVALAMAVAAAAFWRFAVRHYRSTGS